LEGKQGRESASELESEVKLAICLLTVPKIGAGLVKAAWGRSAGSGEIA